MKHLLTAALAVIVSTLCAKAQYVDFLYSNMPLSDSVMYSRQYWEDNVAKTLEVRERMQWGIPEREFRHFVLPLRVNNETLDDFRLTYADSLCARVQGMSLYDAALEINHWCHEMATYVPSDARTMSPMATICAGKGRCGEESVLAVSAMRAAGIPARQIYTPRWAHTDDNHAWVEVWVDGKWHFLGGCEPEPRLDMAWFNGPVSRAMVLHTKAFGRYDGPEDAMSRTEVYTEINVTPGYVPVRTTAVRVLDTDGRPVQGAAVEYKIYNYAEFYTVARKLSDEAGMSSLETGCGDVMIWASLGDRFGMAVAGSEMTDVVLDHQVGERLSLDFDIVPPAEHPIPTDATAEEIEANAIRLAGENDYRAARPKGNEAVLDAFRERYAGRASVAEALVASLTEKDVNDVSADVLDDAMAHAGRRFRPYRDCPRVENEFLRPYLSEIGTGLRLRSPRRVAQWVRDNIVVDDARNPQRLRMTPASVWEARVADSRSREIFYVALCRAKGFSARIEPVTGKLQYRRMGRWHDVDLGDAVEVTRPQGQLRLAYGQVPHLSDPRYYKHFTLSEIRDGSCVLLNYGEDVDMAPLSTLFASPSPVDAAYYMLTSGSRMADGSVLAHVECFALGEGESLEVPLVIRHTDAKVSVIGSMSEEQRFLQDGESEERSLLSATGRGYFIVAVVGDQDEPSTHAVRQLSAVADELNAWGRKVIVLGKARPDGLETMICGMDVDGKVLDMLCSGCESESRQLPVVAVCDTFGRTVYFSQGYNTSLSEELRSVISAL